MAKGDITISEDLIKDIYSFMGEVRSDIKSMKTASDTITLSEKTCRKDIDDRLKKVETYQQNQKAYWVALLFIATALFGLVDMVIRYYDKLKH